MDNNAVVEQIVQSLSFDVEAVPKHKTVTSSSRSTPLNVKIRVRKKDDLSMRHGVISIPKFDYPERVPQKIRLINSDQTIMSFDVFMEAEFEDKPLRKPRKHLFDMLKTGICLGASDDDGAPYMPSSSYSANVTEGSTNSRSDGVLKHNFTLSKNTNDENGDPTKGKRFLGKCKPGGCLDPPYGEDKYSYKPAIQEPLPNEENTLKEEIEQETDSKHKRRRSSVFDSGIFTKKRKSSDKSTGTRGPASIKANQSNSILNLYQFGSNVNSLSTTQSNSIITYPPALTSSELPINDERNRSRISSEDKSRKSFNEFTDGYFIPPKGINKIKDKKKDMISDTDDYDSKLSELDKDNKKTKPIETLKMPVPFPIPVPLNSETVETAAAEPNKANVGDVGSKLSDSRLLLKLKNDINQKIPSVADNSQQKIGREELFTADSNAMEDTYDPIGNFNKKIDTESKRENSSLISIRLKQSWKEQEVSPIKSDSMEKLRTKDNNIPKNALTLLNQHENIPKLIIPPKQDDVEIKDTAEKATEYFLIAGDESQKKISLITKDTLEKPSDTTRENHLKEHMNQNEKIMTQSKDDEDEILKFKEDELSQESPDTTQEDELKEKIGQNEQTMTQSKTNKVDLKFSGRKKSDTIQDELEEKKNQNEQMITQSKKDEVILNILEDKFSQKFPDTTQEHELEEKFGQNEQMTAKSKEDKLDLKFSDNIIYSQKSDTTQKDDPIKKLLLNEKKITQSKEDDVNMIFSENNLSQKSSSLFEPAIFERQDSNINGRDVYQNTDEIVPRPKHTEVDTNIKPGENEIIPFKNDNNDELLKSDNASYLNDETYSSIHRPIKGDTDEIKQQLQSQKNIKNIEFSTDEIISENHSFITASAITDTNFRKLASVDSETNLRLVGEHSINIRHKERYDDHENELKGALRTGDTDLVDDYDSSALTSIIKSTPLNLVGEQGIDIINKEQYDEGGHELKAALRTGDTDLVDDYDSSDLTSIIKSTPTNFVVELGIDITNKEQCDEDENEVKAALRTGGTDLVDDYDSIATTPIIKSTPSNLVGEHGIDIRNIEQYDEDENEWEAALRTSGTDLVDDYDSIASTTIIKLTPSNLVGEHGIDIRNKEQYDEGENQWKGALRASPQTYLVDDYDSSPSTSIIKSTQDKEVDYESSALPSMIISTQDKVVRSPDKRIVIPILNTTVSPKTISKTGEIPGESKVPRNELDKKLSYFSKSYVGSTSVASSIPSNSTLKSVLKKDTVSVDLAFQSYLNEKNERVFKTFDTADEPRRYLNDSITLVKSQLRLSANEIRIPIDTENDMFIHIKKSSVNQHVHISKSELETDTKHGMESSNSKCHHEIDRDYLHDTLLEIYEQDLVPLQLIIKALKDEIDVLASQQMVFKDKVFSPKKSKPARVVHSNRRCGCIKKL